MKRLQQLFDEGFGPWIAIIGFEMMILAALCQGPITSAVAVAFAAAH